MEQTVKNILPALKGRCELGIAGYTTNLMKVFFFLFIPPVAYITVVS
jgi:hypothetical protein